MTDRRCVTCSVVQKDVLKVFIWVGLLYFLTYGPWFFSPVQSCPLHVLLIYFIDRLDSGQRFGDLNLLRIHLGVIWGGLEAFANA